MAVYRGNEFGFSTASTGLLALSYLFISTLEKVYYSLMSDFETTQFDLSNVDENKIRTILNVFIQHSTKNALNTPYSLVDANCINSLFRVLREALPEYGFTDYEETESLTPSGLSDILKRKTLMTEKDFQEYKTLSKSKDLNFGKGFENLTTIQQKFKILESDKYKRWLELRRGLIWW